MDQRLDYSAHDGLADYDIPRMGDARNRTAPPASRDTTEAMVAQLAAQAEKLARDRDRTLDRIDRIRRVTALISADEVESGAMFMMTYLSPQTNHRLTYLLLFVNDRWYRTGTNPRPMRWDELVQWLAGLQDMMINRLEVQRSTFSVAPSL